MTKERFQKILAKCLSNSSKLHLFFMTVTILYYYGYIAGKENPILSFLHINSVAKLYYPMKFNISFDAIYKIFPNIKLDLTLYALIYLIRKEVIKKNNNFKYGMIIFLNIDFLKLIFSNFMLIIFNPNVSRSIFILFILMNTMLFAIFYYYKSFRCIIRHIIKISYFLFNIINDSEIKDNKGCTDDTFNYLKMKCNYDFEVLIKDFCEKFNFDSKYIYISDFAFIDHTFLKFDLKEFKFKNYIILSLDSIKSGQDIISFILKHEYGHVKNNSCFYIFIFLVLTEIILASFIYFYMNTGWFKNNYILTISNETKDFLKIFEMFSITNLISFFLNIFFISFRRYEEFRADDFAVDSKKDLSELAAFIFIIGSVLEKENYASIEIFHPEFFPFITHPSLYHRYKRQEIRYSLEE